MIYFIKSVVDSIISISIIDVFGLRVSDAYLINISVVRS